MSSVHAPRARATDAGQHPSSANLLWVLLLLPWYGIATLRSFTQGHSKGLEGPGGAPGYRQPDRPAHAVSPMGKPWHDDARLRPFFRSEAPDELYALFQVAGSQVERLRVLLCATRRRRVPRAFVGGLANPRFAERGRRDHRGRHRRGSSAALETRSAGGPRTAWARCESRGRMEGPLHHRHRRDADRRRHGRLLVGDCGCGDVVSRRATDRFLSRSVGARYRGRARRRRALRRRLAWVSPLPSSSVWPRSCSSRGSSPRSRMRLRFPTKD